MMKVTCLGLSNAKLVIASNPPISDPFNTKRHCVQSSGRGGSHDIAVKTEH
jgi:hypothetical protein